MASCKNYQPGSLGCHEALHMASFFAGSIEVELVDHAAVAANPEWLALATRARDALVELYQAVGKVHDEGQR